MKKFSFSLARLKKFREQILETEKNTLGRLRVELAELQRELEDILNLIEQANEQLRQSYVEGTMPRQIALKKRYIATRQQEAAEKRAAIAKKQQAVEKQLQVVIAATKDVATLEKLEEHQIEAYRAAELKETELFIEEFVQNADFRKQAEM